MKSLVRTVDATEEPVTAEEAMAYLRVDNADEKADIEALITVARGMVEDFTGRALMTQTWKLTLDDWPGDTIELARSPLASVTSVKYYPASGAAQATLSAATYHALTGPTPGQIVLKDGETWPDLAVRPDAIEVIFVAGNATAEAVPAILRHAVLFAVAHLYENRTPVNIGNIVNELPFSLKHMLESYRVGGWVA